MAGSDIDESLEAATCGMPGVHEVRGRLDATGLSFALVVGRYHTPLTRALAAEVIRELQACGAASDDLTAIWVPGSFEVPIVLDALAEHKSHDAYIALGAVIEGETSHAQSIVDGVTRALGELARTHRVPIMDGIVAAPTEEIARVRCLPGPSCRGPYLARAAVEMARVLEQLPQRGML